MSLCIIKSAWIKQGKITVPLFGRQSLPQRIVFQIRPETFEGHCRIKLSPGFSSLSQFNLRHFSDPLRSIMARNRFRSRKFRIGAEGSHKRPPGEFSSRQRTNDAVGRRVESLDIGNVRRHLLLQKISDSPIEVRSLNLRLVSLHLCERIATDREQTREN